uniref:Uncharacterized protein n=1 Tax=Oryza glumipatula TaxID=40148 RepID=A0A0D9YBL4_9ORYZ
MGTSAPQVSAAVPHNSGAGPARSRGSSARRRVWEPQSHTSNMRERSACKLPAGPVRYRIPSPMGPPDIAPPPPELTGVCAAARTAAVGRWEAEVRKWRPEAARPAPGRVG